MTTERVCRDCGKPITADHAPTVLDDFGLCERCSAETAQSPDMAADRSRRTRWIAVAVSLAGAAVALIALIGVTNARKHGGADQAWGGDDNGYGDDQAADDGLDDELDDFDDFGGFCEDCGDKAWIHYCPECHRSDD